MKTFSKANKLENVLYDVRGPVVDEANRMEEMGMKILKLNIGNPAPFGFSAPEEVILDMRDNIVNSQGYSDSRGTFAARRRQPGWKRRWQAATSPSPAIAAAPPAPSTPTRSCSCCNA